MISIFLVVFSTLLAFGAVVEAPVVSIDFAQNPSGIEWKKIESDHFEVIFPKEVEEQAQRVTHLLEKVYSFVGRSLETNPRKISLILQNQSTNSNGFVSLAPRRSEWYMTPAVDPEIANTEWLKTLAIHEYRHVVQFEKSRQGFNKYFEYLLGEYGQAIGIGLTAPPWYLEGDAVGIETALTHGGRGRLPVFERNLRALLLSGEDYDYDKAHLGSYEDFIPNHYVYGYFLTSYMRNQEGDLFLSKLTDEATLRSYNPLTFYNSYYRLTGLQFEKFYRSTMSDLLRLWKEKLDLIKPSPFTVKSLEENKGWTNYLYPQPVKEGKFLALKRGLSHIDQFVITDGRQDDVLFYPGPLIGEYPIKLRGGRFAFVEQEIDPRWGYRDFTRIKVWDIEKKRFTLDLRHTKGRLATLDEKGEQLAWVEWNDNQKQSIKISDSEGIQLKQISYPTDRVITSLDWISSEALVMVVKGHDDQKEVIKLGLTDLSEEIVLPPAYTNYGFINVHQGHILLESPQSGIDNIYLVQDQMTKQLTSSRFGAYAPALWQDKLIYNDYTAKGMQIVAKDLSWDEEQNSDESFVPVYQKFGVHEDRAALEREFFNRSKYPVQKYSQFKNVLNLHSWVILAPPLSSTVTLTGISRDVLNKFALSFGGEYDLNEQNSKVFVSSAWSHYYPVFDLRAAYGGRRQDLIISNRVIENKWEEGTFEAGAQIPWKKISGRFTHSFSARTFSKLIKVTNKLSSDRSEVRDGALHSPGFTMNYSTLSRLARRDLNPDWGISARGQFEEGKDISGVDQRGSLLSLEGVTFLPGLIRHHSFYHQVVYERQRDNSYQYSTPVLRPRGTRSFFLEEFRKYSANYSAPLFYPDWSLGRSIYFKRIWANAFYDELNGRLSSFSYKAASAGWELLSEMNFFRIFIPITIGLRGSYPLRGLEKDNQYEVFLATQFGAF